MIFRISRQIIKQIYIYLYFNMLSSALVEVHTELHFKENSPRADKGWALLIFSLSREVLVMEEVRAQEVVMLIL